MSKGQLFAQKHFVDGNQGRVAKGDVIPDGKYDSATITHYRRYGMVGNHKPGEGPKETKPAGPDVKKAEEEAKAKAEEEAKTKAEEEAKTKAEEEAKAKSDAKAKGDPKKK